MKYVRMKADTPFYGTEMTDCFEVPDNVTDEELDAQCEEMTIENADNFSYLATGWDDDFEDDDARDNYYNDCSGSWEFISEEEYREELAYWA